jgi:short-subunit dehydrogenase
MPEGDDLRTRYGPVALITGAAQGIGEALARVLAQEGLQLVLVDRQAERLRAVAESIGGSPRVLVEDLSDPGAVDRIAAAVQELELGLVAHVAAFTVFGDVLDEDPAALAATIDVNCRVPLLLTRALAPAMRKRGRGGVLLLSSLAAWQGAPRLAAYTASRAYTLNLAQSLWLELRPHGVDVLGVCPGATRTPGFDSLRPDARVLRRVPTMQPEAVAREALSRLPEGPVWVVGWRNRLAHAVLTRVLSRRLANRVIAGNLRALYRR